MKGFQNPNTRRLIAAAILIAIVVWYVLATLHRNTTLYTSSEDRTISFGPQKTKIALNRFSGVETLRGEKSELLVGEISKVLKQKGMPADIFVDKVSDTCNIAVTLYNAFLEYDEQPDPLKKIWGASPETVWDADKEKIAGVADILKEFEPKRLAIRGMLDLQKTVFYYLFVLDRKTGIAQVDTDASRFIADYALLEEYAVAGALINGDINGAMEPLAYVFRLAQLADKLKVCGVRADAVLTRLRMFRVMQRIVLDPKFQKAHLAFLRDMLAEQHKHRTPEFNVWFGDRASGIALFHRILILGLEASLEPQELQLLMDRNIYNTFLKSYYKNHAFDEAYYLQAAQRYLNVCREPYYKRREVIDQENNGLLKLQDTKTEPVIAGILLKDIPRLMRLYAQDISRMEAVLLAMQLSLGQEDAANEMSDPFNGKPYSVKRENGYIEVSAENNLEPFRVKDYSALPIPSPAPEKIPPETKP